MTGAPLTAATVAGLICPRCRGRLLQTEGGLRCGSCAMTYEDQHGAHVLLPAEIHGHSEDEEAYWRDIAPRHERDWREDKAHLVRAFEKLVLRRAPAGRTLEIGAGLCWASALLKRSNPSTHVTTTDISPSAFAIARRVFEQVGAQPDRLVACDMEQLPFEDDQFNLVFGIAVLHHAHDVTPVLREVRRVLKPGGTYFGMDEFAASPLSRRYWQTSRFSPFARRHGDLGVREEVYTLDEWRRSVHAAGFSSVSVRLNRDPSLKRAGLRPLYFRATGPLPDSLFRHLPGASIVIEAQK